MEVIRELNRLFNRRQKKQLVGIFFLILIGGFFEMLSVSMMLPVVSAM